MISKRKFLEYIGSACGASGVYRSMEVLGLLRKSNSDIDFPITRRMTSTVTDKRVIVLGAGISGLVAAYELHNLGYDVTVLEASSRAGGRNLTARRGTVIQEDDSSQQVDFDMEDHLYSNLGPARIPYHHEALLGYCSKFNIPLETFNGDNRGTWKTCGRTENIPKPLRGAIEGHKGYVYELISKCSNPLLLDENITREEADRLIDIFRFYDVIKRKLEIWPDDLVNLLFSSPINLFKEFGQETLSQPILFQPVGGMDRIVDAFLSKIGHLIEYNCSVKYIKISEHGVKLTYKHKGTDYTSFSPYVVTTLPSPIYRSILTNFSRQTNIGLDEIIYTNPVKVAIQSRKRFWEIFENMYGGITWEKAIPETTKTSITQVWYPSHGYHQEKGIITGAYILGVPGFDQETAYAFEKMSPRKRYETTVDRVYRLHRTAIYSEAGVSCAWRKMPFSKGGWPITSAPKSLEEPEGNRVFFAGDMMSSLTGWQEGAVLSAWSAVESLYRVDYEIGKE